MQRAALERDRAARVMRLRQSRLARGQLSGGAADERLSVGHFRKSWRVAGCMKPRCWQCQYEKRAGEPTAADRRNRARLREGIAALYASS